MKYLGEGYWGLNFGDMGGDVVGEREDVDGLAEGACHGV
jgi:hypothetical protein